MINVMLKPSVQVVCLAGVLAAEIYVWLIYMQQDKAKKKWDMTRYALASCGHMRLVSNAYGGIQV